MSVVSRNILSICVISKLNNNCRQTVLVFLNMYEAISDSLESSEIMNCIFVKHCVKLPNLND